ncbi:MAG TPA: Bax inhibitor-1 family protein [Candidatus Saccharimonadales bacterium]|nr:Bax inhibitor-1 family protein [Candidatus Saccharimonadales bacterium]
MSDLSGSFADKTFEDRRRQQPTSRDIMLSIAEYYSVMIVGILVAYGVMAGVAVVSASNGWVPTSTLGVIALLVGVFACMFGGGVIVLNTGWLPSVLAYLGLIAAPFGVLAGMIASEIGMQDLLPAVVILAALTVILGTIGLRIRTDLSCSGFAKAINVLLWVFVILSFVTIQAQIHSDTFYIVITGVGILLFSCVTVLDFNRAKFMPKTLDNAVDSSMLIYLSNLNLLLRIWGLLSKLRGNN